MLDLADLPVLIAVIDTGSIQAAARELGLARPTVRRRLDQLESSVGTALVFRGPNGLEPTDAGRILRARGREILDELSALSRAARRGASVRGPLRVVVPTGLPGVIGRHMSATVSSKWPEVALTLSSASVPYGALLEDVDCMITLRLEDPGPRFATFDLAVIPERLFVTESYLAQRGPIESLAQLASHRVVSWFCPDDGRPTGLPIAGRTIDWDFAFCADAVQLLAGWFPDAVTLAPYLPQMMAMAGFDAIAPVLPQLVGRDRPLRLVVAKAMVDTPVVRSFVEMTCAAATAFMRANPARST